MRSGPGGGVDHEAPGPRPGNEQVIPFLALQGPPEPAPRCLS